MPVSRSHNFHHVQRALIYYLDSNSWGNLAFLDLFWANVQSMLTLISDNQLPAPVERWCLMRYCKPRIKSELQESTRKKGFYCALGSILNCLPVWVKTFTESWGSGCVSAMASPVTSCGVLALIANDSHILAVNGSQGRRENAFVNNARIVVHQFLPWHHVWTSLCIIIRLKSKIAIAQDLLSGCIWNFYH